MRVRQMMVAALMATSLMGASACAGDDLSDDDTKGDDKATSSNTASTDTDTDKGELRLSGQSFDEAALMASMYELLLDRAGYDVETKLVTSRDIYMNQFPDDIDVAPEYVGGTIEFLNTTQNGADAKPLSTGDLEATLAAGAGVLKKKGVTLLDPAEAADTNAFFVTEEYAEENSVSKLSDLEGKTVTLAAHPDCAERLDCGKGLEEVYGIKIDDILPLGFASAQTFKSVEDDESQLGLTSTTDGTLEARGMVLLEDDKAVQPVQNLVPAVSTKFLKAHPDVADVLNPLMAILTTDDLVELNGRVTAEREKASDVAKDYLEDHDLL
ncbi:MULTISPECIES: ABC transporter substrate-binding protein [unclassified Nocardioides]|uniref:ABC transporter substrate-binding protein n=1 Tax=unclassified Nocardioides TaxID=2615069 RepID=UPI0006FF0DFD|nr:MULTISPECIES: ABC transporter substrate-binding protein [unclassified Nocardioides]KQY50220.1 hypothetical protein ASD30_22135 [Nocardioides sp. Root140]KRF14916.1 hypothetical protein ASH02_11650 [Nocardioides sp. Soil796]